MRLLSKVIAETISVLTLLTFALGLLWLVLWLGSAVLDLLN
jgi:hypothetical protein